MRMDDVLAAKGRITARGTFVLVAWLACALALCLGLVGCGAGEDVASEEGAAASAAASEVDPHVGYWQLESGTGQDGDELSSDDLAAAREQGRDVVLHLTENGTGRIDVFGSVDYLTWDADTGTIDLDGNTIQMTLGDDGKLVLDDGSGTMTFAKGDSATLADFVNADQERDMAASEGATSGEATSARAQ